MPEKIVYALPEMIGNTDLFVGRKKEFDFFLGDWYLYLEKNFTQNQAIISRRKKGKTAFLQRLFNILWSACLDDQKQVVTVVPFYFSVKDSRQTLGEFSAQFFTEFIKCYTSYIRKDPSIFEKTIPFEKLGKYIEDENIRENYEALLQYNKEQRFYPMWDIVSTMPVSVARTKNIKIVQIIDEFQNINEYIVDQHGEKLDRMSGTYMQVAEMREAPVIVSGSEVHWLLRIVSSLTGRFQVYNLANLPEEEAKAAMEKYADYSGTTIDSRAKEKIWRLTKGDPLYIKALFLSRYNRQKDYTIEDNIVEVYEREIDDGGEIYWTWMEYMLKTFHTVNKINSKRIMLYLFNQGKERTRDQIKKDLNLPYTDEALGKKLEALIGGDLISHGK
ncbi:MAG: ATP-binding protein, partial [Thermotogota bacterium]|nr:ATP-binding protein [Thermotogota bacterium]